MTRTDNRLLGYAPVPVYRQDGQLFVEDQAAKGLAQWAHNFDRVEMMTLLERGPPPPGWSPWDPSMADFKARYHILPTAYRPDQFLRALPRTAPRIRALIQMPVYRSFAIGGLFGDWGAVAALLAQRAGKSHAVWTDRIESAVIREEAKHGPLKTRLRKSLSHRPMAALERYVVRRADMGLFNGDETFEHFAPLCRAPVRVNDISLERHEHIDEAALREKQARAADGRLRILYAGRAVAMKGTMDWCKTLIALAARGVAFDATWLGDGQDMPAMRRAIAEAGLQDRVAFPGFTSDREQILQALRGAHVFLFCHRTPESPRCLIEALASGTPIVGYDSAYARGLINGTDAGSLHPLGDTDSLAAALEAIDHDRAHLARRMGTAQKAGWRFEITEVFRHRAEAIRAHMTP